jgi:hypothetical protein
MKIHQFFPPNNEANYDKNLLTTLRTSLFQTKFFTTCSQTPNPPNFQNSIDELNLFISHQLDSIHVFEKSVYEKLEMFGKIIDMSRSFVERYTSIKNEIDCITTNYNEKEIEFERKVLDLNTLFNIKYSNDIELLTKQLRISNETIQVVSNNNSIQLQSLSSSLQESNLSLSELNLKLVNQAKELSVIKCENVNFNNENTQLKIKISELCEHVKLLENELLDKNEQIVSMKIENESIKSSCIVLERDNLKYQMDLKTCIDKLFFDSKLYFYLLIYRFTSVSSSLEHSYDYGKIGNEQKLLMNGVISNGSHFNVNEEMCESNAVIVNESVLHKKTLIVNESVFPKKTSFVETCESFETLLRKLEYLNSVTYKLIGQSTCTQ